MKRALTALLALLLLAGCGHAPSEAPEETPEESPERPLEAEPAPAPEGLSLKVEREVYDPSLTRYTYFIYNNTDHTVEFGDPYQIQRLEGDVWQDLTPREDWGFSLIGYILSPGGTFVRTCTLDYYQEPPEAGRYRLLKDMGDDGVLTAEFSLGDSPYTAEAPYGLAPLETLPLSYGAADAAGTGAVLFTVAGEENLKAADEFLQKSSLGAACQLRTVQDFGENDPLIIDVVYDGRYLWRMRQGDYFLEKWFSYIITDGTDLYLSNGADWENSAKYGSDKAFLLPEFQSSSGIVEAVRTQMSERLERGAARYLLWSGDGVWHAGLSGGTAPTEFSVGWSKPEEGSAAGLYNLQDWDGVETAITGVSWQEDGTLLLQCETVSGDRALRVFDPETERLAESGGAGICGLPPAP